MAKLKNFKGSVPISSGLCGIGGRDYPLVQAHDVQVDEDGTRLDEKLESIGGGGGNANFIFADSEKELPDPSTVPEDTVALVPSSGGGLPVVELTTVATTEGAALTDAENAKMNEMSAAGMPFILKCPADDGTMFLGGVVSMIGMAGGVAAVFTITCAGIWTVIITSEGGTTWKAIFSSTD